MGFLVKKRNKKEENLNLKVDDEIKNILKRYEEKLGRRVVFDRMEFFPGEKFSREYTVFRKEALEKSISRYERWCNLAEGLFKVSPSKKIRKNIEDSIERVHLDITPEGAMSFAALIGGLIFLFGLGLLIASFIMGYLMLLVPFVFMIVGLVSIGPLSKRPISLANKWRLEASNQMILCILYVIMYMKHTSNLEHAIKFAGEHVGPPLALDLRKVFWDVEVGKFVSIKESLDNYLEGWRDYNLEFLESFHLIEGSLYEISEEKRVGLLNKSLEVMLEGTYDRMMHYAQDLKSPITMLHMLGVILPVLGLVIFPLLASFMQGLVSWYHLAVLYNILLPLMVITLGNHFLEKRPSGYGEADILKQHPEYQQYEYINFAGAKISPKVISTLIIFVFCFIGFLPLMINFISPSSDITLFEGTPLAMGFLDYKCNSTGCSGPYGTLSLVLSLFIPLGLAFGLAFYYWFRSKKLIHIKNRTHRLEQEFSGALFQLGNRVGEGIPVEMAFGRVAETMKGTPTGNFFRYVDINIRRAGMGIKEAIFGKERGAILYYPSSLIESSMKVLVESAKKGPQIVATSLITISDYIKRVNHIVERLKDLLADILSSMKSQISFLTPAIAGIVVGVSSMIVTIINKLSEQLSGASLGEFGAETAGTGVAGLAGILSIKDVIPSFYFQLVVGLYVVEITIILTILSNGIKMGVDKTQERYDLGKNLVFATSLYTLICLIGIIVFNILASGITLVTSAAG